MTRSRLVAAGAAVLALVLVLAFAHHALIAFALQRALSVATGTTFRFRDVHLGTSHAAFFDVHVSKNGDPLADAQRVDVDYNLHDLLPGGTRLYGIEAVAVAHPVFTLVRHRDGTYNLGAFAQNNAPATARSGTPPMRLTARVRGGEIHLVDDAPLEPDLATQSIVDIGVTADIDSNARSLVQADASLLGRRTQTAPLGAYPLAIRSTVDVRRGFTQTRARAARIPLRGLLNFLIHAPVARFDDGVVNNVNVVAYALGLGTAAPFALQLGGGADLDTARVALQALEKPITGLHGHIDLFGDGVTTRGLAGDVGGIPLHVRGGVYDFAQLQFRLAVGGGAELVRLKTLFAFLNTQPVRGGITIETLIAGSVSDPLIRTALAADRVYYGTIPLDRLHGIVDYEHGGVTFTGVHAGFGPLRAVASGNVDVSRRDAFVEAFVDAIGPAAQIPYAQAVAPDATIDAHTVVLGTGDGGFRAGGTIAAVGPQSRGVGFVAVDERGRGEFGPFVFDRRDGTSLSGALRIERPTSASAGWIAVRGYRIDIPRRLATLPGVAIPPFPQVGGVVDASVVAGGPPSDFTVAGRVHVRRAGFQTYALGNADLDLAGTLADLRLENVRVDGPIGSFRGGGAASGGLFALGGRYVGSLEALAPFTGRIGARGPVRAPVVAVVDGRGITVQTTDAAMAGASIRGFPLDRAAGTMQIDGGRVRIVAASADVAGRSAVAASTDHRIAISAADLPATALAAAGVPLEAGSVSVFGLADSRGPSFEGSVDLAGGRTRGGYPVNGWADLVIAGPTLGVRDGIAGIGSTYARIGGRLDDIGSKAPVYALAANIPLGDVAGLARDLRLPVRNAEGSFAATVRVSGAGGLPHIAGTVDAPEGAYNGLDFADAGGRFTLDADSGLHVQVADGRVHIHATPLRFDAAVAPGALALHVASPAANLVDFDDYFDESGLLAGSGPVALTFADDGRTVSTYGRFALAGARVRRFPLGDVRALWGMHGGHVAGSFTTDAPTGGLGASGTIVPAAGGPLAAFAAARYEGDIRGRNVDLGSWLPALGFSQPVFGRLSASGHLRGVFPRIAIGGQASVTGGMIGKYPVTAANLRTRIVGERVGIDDAVVDLGFVRFTSAGLVGVDPTDPLSLHIHASVPDVGEAARRIVRDAPDVGGTLEADALISGSYAKPRIRAGVDLENGRYGQFAVQHVIGDVESDLASVRLDSAEIAFGRGSAVIAGSLPITLSPPGVGPPNAPLSITADARDLDLSPFASLVPGRGTKLGGTVNGRLALQGTVFSPRVFGTVTLTNGSYVSDVETSPIRRLNAQVAFSGTSVALQALHGNVGAGTIDGSGQLDLPIAEAPPTGYSIDLTAKGAQLVVPGFGGGTLDGKMQLASGARRPVVSGDVLLYDTTIPFATIFKATGSSEGESGPPLDLGLDLHAEAGKNVRIKSSIIDVAATGGVTLTGTLLRPRADGVLTATRGGVFSTYARLFRIADATVTFDPAQGIVPNLDLHATAHVTNPDPDTTRNAIGSADITVSVTGPADSYTVAYASVPPYSQEQIVALLAAIPLLGAVNFDQPQAVGTLRGAPGESNVLLPPGVTIYQTGVYSFGQEAFSLLNTQLTQRLLSPVENTFGGALGLTDLQLTLDYGGRVGYTARKQISAKRQVAVTLGQVLSYPTRTQFGLTAQPDATTSASFSFFTQNGTPSYTNSIFGNTSNVQVLNGIQPLSNRQGFSAVITRTYP